MILTRKVVIPLGALLLFAVYFGLFRYVSGYIIVCSPTAKLERVCNEYEGALYGSQTYSLPNAKLGYVQCGKLLNCETSPCRPDPELTAPIWCYKKGDAYRMDNKVLQLVLDEMPLATMTLMYIGLFIVMPAIALLVNIMHCAD